MDPCPSEIPMVSDDPMERIIRDALLSAGFRFVEGDRNDSKLDFYLPRFGLCIEVKQFHSDRISRQMKQADNVIVAQGAAAVRWLASLIAAGSLNPSTLAVNPALGSPQAAVAGCNAQPPRPTVRTPDFDSGNGGSSPPEAANG